MSATSDPYRTYPDITLCIADHREFLTQQNVLLPITPNQSRVLHLEVQMMEAKVPTTPVSSLGIHCPDRGELGIGYRKTSSIDIPPEVQDTQRF
ncbi:hypothetical protein J6590_085529 [Homalodisca vitripennis]|nr:hypothetical protein J6590_085529 [Homalodisca vitripennis]